MRLIYFADSHIRGVNPINRIGNYYSDVMTKIKETISIAKEKKANKIIHGGDLYDSPFVSNIMIDELIDIIEESNIEWLILPGNHDEIGHSWELSKSSSLAHIFRRSKFIKELTSRINKDIKPSFIQGFKYYHNIEKDIKEKGLFIPTTVKTLEGLKIAVVHAMITPKPILPQIMHIQMKEIKTDFDIVFCAHNHYAWDIKEVNGTKFVNTGAFGRRSINEISFTPKVVYIDTETREIELIPLKSAKKGEEVFDLAKVETAKAFEANIDNFIKSLEDKKFQSLDLKGLVELLAKENNIDKEIKDEVISRIGREENE